MRKFTLRGKSAFAFVWNALSNELKLPLVSYQRHEYAKVLIQTYIDNFKIA